MSDQKNQSRSLLPSLFDTVLVIGILALVGIVIFNTVRINSLNKEAEKTVAQLCWMTQMVFGPPDTSLTQMEACNNLRNEIYESWEALK